MNEPSPWRSAWTLSDDVTYLNHGSFGPSPIVVQQARREWSERLERQPMQFLLRELEDEAIRVESELEDWLNAPRGSVVGVDNATFGMNVVAHSVQLAEEDVVVLTDHEYGAVARIWRKRCAASGARCVVVPLPLSIASADNGVSEWIAQLPARTKLLVVSHVTSPTSLVLPVAKICREACRSGVQTCIDGPHASAMIEIDLRVIGCDYYVASCHKWLSAGFGSGFLYVAASHRGRLCSPIVSWGRSVQGRPAEWRDEFRWLGTRDPAAFLTIPTAIAFLREVGFDTFRKHADVVLRHAVDAMQDLFGVPNPLYESGLATGTMVTLPLSDDTPRRAKPNDPHPWQRRLWQDHRIEVPIVEWGDRCWIRVSAHLYNTADDVDRLVVGLRELRDAPTRSGDA